LPFLHVKKKKIRVKMCNALTEAHATMVIVIVRQAIREAVAKPISSIVLTTPLFVYTDIATTAGASVIAGISARGVI
jgi:hypothetical protein